MVLHSAVVYCATQALRYCRGRQARIDAAFGSILEDHPRLGLSRLSFWDEACCRIGRMHLHREPFPHIEKLQEKRKSREPPGQFSHELPRRLLQQFIERLPLERALRDQARMVFPVAQNPCFPDRTFARQWSGEQLRQTASTPESILVDRLKSERIERYLFDEFLSVIKGSAIAVPR